MSKPGVCFYSVANHLGGGERSMLDLVTSLHREGTVAPWVLLPGAEGRLAELLAEAGVPTEILPLPALIKAVSRDRGALSLLLFVLGVPGLLLYLFRFWLLLLRRRPAILHTNGIKCHLLGAFIAGCLGVPVVWHIRDILSRGASRAALQAARRVFRPWLLCNSEASADALSRDSRTRVVHNGISPAKPANAPDLRATLGLAPGGKLLGILGVLARWKGQELFLDLGRALLAEGHDVRLVVVGGKIYDTVGDDDFEALLRRKASSPELAGKVHFTGFVDNPQDYLRQLDALVHCSLNPEPFGRVIVEAMVCGVPVIAANAGGVREIVTDGSDGLLYEPGNLGALQAAATRLLREPDLSPRLAEKGRKTARDRFSPEAHRDGVLRVYGQVLQR